MPEDSDDRSRPEVSRPDSGIVVRCTHVPRARPNAQTPRWPALWHGGAFSGQCLGEIETICVHNLGPCGSEVIVEFRRGIVRGVDVGDRTQD